MTKKRLNEADITAKTEEARQRYAVQNPEFAIPMSKRANDIYSSIFHDEEGKTLPMRAIAENAACFNILVDAVVPQLEKNGDWQVLLQQAKLNEPQCEAADGQGAAVSNGTTVSRPHQIACDIRRFNGSKRTFKKTVAEILTDETELLDYSEDGDDFAGENDDAAFYDLSDITISPKRINNTLLKNLGLSQYLPPKNATRAKRMAAYKEAIPAINEMLSSLEPLTLPHEADPSDIFFFRLMRIGKGPNAGKLLGTQYVNGNKYFFLTDLNRADRRLDHIRETYAHEIRQLIVDFKATIEAIDRDVSGKWAAIRDSDELERIKKELFGMVDDLKYVSNEYKQEIRDILSKCTSLKTTRVVSMRKGASEDGTRTVKRIEQTIEVYNPGAMRAMWNKAKRLIGPRLDEIARIEGHLAEDRVRIGEYIAEQEAPFDKFYDEVERNHTKYGTLDLSKPITEDSKKGISTGLQRRRAALVPGDEACGKGITYEPYASFAKQMVVHVDRLLELCKQPDDINLPDNRKKFSVEMVNMYLVSKIQVFFHQFQEFCGEFLSPDRVPYFITVRNRLQALDDLIKGKTVDEQIDGELIKTPEYNDIFGSIYKLIGELKALSSQGIEAKRNKDDDTARKIKNKMHDQASDFDFQNLMQNVGVGKDEDAGELKVGEPVLLLPFMKPKVTGQDN
jgi:hypothetical protein